MVDTQLEIRALLDSRSDAIRTKDLDLLMSFYSPDVVYFDIVPPLQYTGAAALRARIREWFASFDGPIGQEIRGLSVANDGALAAACMLIHATGTLMKSGQQVQRWVRASSYFTRSERLWLVTHEHISLPVDLESGTAVQDSVP